jgi:predicted DNA binding protein
MFLKIMGEKGDEEQLCSFLNTVLEREGRDAITSVEIVENKTMTAEVIGDKTSILDVRSVTAAEERISIEVQLRNLGNMDKKDIRNNKEHLWLAWLDKDSPRELLEEIARMEPAIMKAAEKMARVSMSKEALRAYQMREMAMSDWTSGLNHARREGIKEGKLEIALKMKNRKIPLEEIAEYTGLSPENITKL